MLESTDPFAPGGTLRKKAQQVAQRLQERIDKVLQGNAGQGPPGSSSSDPTDCWVGLRNVKLYGSWPATENIAQILMAEAGEGSAEPPPAGCN